MEPLLTPDTYAVLRGVPAEWMDRELVVGELVVATKQGKTAVTKRLAWLLRLGLVECRGGHVVPPRIEVRKVAKVE